MKLPAFATSLQLIFVITNASVLNSNYVYDLSASLEPRQDGTACTRQLKNPPPPNLICGETGTINPKLAGVLQTASKTILPKCRDLCLDDPKCLSLSFNPSQKNCTTYAKSLRGGDFNSSRSNKDRYYARGCFTDPPANSTSCSGKCVDTSSDTQNCGACGSTCVTDPGGPTKICSKGMCFCHSGGFYTIACDGKCVDFTNDPNNCSRCGIKCGQNEICSNRQCTCDTGYQQCDGPGTPCQPAESCSTPGVV